MSLLGVELAYWQQEILRTVGVLVMVILPAGGFVYVFLFKMMSFMQSRLGPMEAGPHGSIQLLAEVGKFLQKEDIVPERADRRLFFIAPYIVLSSTFLLLSVMPFGPDVYFTDLDTAIFLAMGLSSVSVIGILIAGWASANKYSLIGGLRAAGQLIAYELPMVLAIVGVVIQAGTLNLQGIVSAQHEGALFGIDAVGNPFVITQIVGFVVFLVATQAELTQTPFDMPVAESEIVTGYITEYSGLRFLLFFIAPYIVLSSTFLLLSVMPFGPDV
ncbi:MAG: complex I subunit 1/NuoH family protein, partial [Acidimicrobiales bacterium]